MATVKLPGQKIIDLIPAGQLAHIGIMQSVPVVQVRWADERETCVTVHAYLAGEIDGHLEDFTGCSGYAAGVCRGTGGAGLPCLFHEPDTSPAWMRAKGWQRVHREDGSTVMMRRS